ncbi:hypothetical protein [Actinomyces faecalis]|uniref:hypothetical protein n=1 Tax=Actinomyces faecalis TaxID=2722820 RepID=UPI001556EFD1|nr:hypothetical protein [Actinomyces faecalis]
MPVTWDFVVFANNRAPTLGFVSIVTTLVQTHHKSLEADLDKYIGPKRVKFTDPHQRGKNDLAYMAYTLLCYRYPSISPDFWTCCGGDLATGMEDLHILLKQHPSLEHQRAANAPIGSDPNAVD